VGKIVGKFSNGKTGGKLRLNHSWITAFNSFKQCLAG